MLSAFLVIAGTAFLWDMLGHSKPRPISMGNALAWTGVYVLAAMIFAGVVWHMAGPEKASLFLAGYVMEKALSVDNLMVFVAIFSYFQIPDRYQHRVLHYGIVGAVVFRLIFVAIGAGALKLWGAPIGLLFGLVVLWSAFKMWTTVGGDDEPVDYSAQWYARWAARLLPFVNFVPRHRPSFFVNAYFNTGYRHVIRRHGTTLLMALIAIEISDVLFSFDSVPAVIAVTKDPVLVYSAMIFAILGLRQLYFVLTALLRYLTRLGGAIVLVLVFIGAKLVADSAHALLPLVGIYPPDAIVIGPVASLAVVLSLLASGVVASMAWPEPEKVPDAPHAR